MHDFKKLEVWKKSRSLVTEIFPLLNSFPQYELFGLVAQMKRASISVPSNIAEGCGRGTNKQLAYHLSIALGSAFELETQLLIAKDLGYSKPQITQDLINKTQEVSRMLVGLSRSLQQS